MNISPQQVFDSLERILHYSDADQTELVFVRSSIGLTRFMKNYIHQNMVRTTHEIKIRVAREGRLGSATTDRLDKEGLKTAVNMALDITRFQKRDKDFSSFPRGKNSLIDTRALDEETARISPLHRADMVASVVMPIEKMKAEANGAFSTSVTELAVVNSEGIRSYCISSAAELNMVVQRENLTAFTFRTGNATTDINAEEIVEEIKPKLLTARKKKTVQPGAYTVILEPYAVATLISYLGYLGFGALAFLEGRSFMAKKRGKKIAHEQVNIVDDGAHKNTLRLPFDYEGVKKEKVVLVDKGIARNVVYDSRTAGMKRGAKNTGHALPAPNTVGPMPLNMVMKPGRRSLSSIMNDVERGIYVTRFHYTNVVEPVSTVLTGMTRDGTFLIENGKITNPITDLRFTQSILDSLMNVKALAKESRLCEGVLGAIFVPALCIEKFNFTGKTA